MPRLRDSLAMLSLCALAAGCLTQRAQEGFYPAKALTSAARSEPSRGASLILLGDAGSPGRTAQRVAEHLATTLADERAAGRTPVVLWLGNMLLDQGGRHRCEQPGQTWQRKGVRDLAQVVRTHVQGGGASFALAGEAAHRCGIADTLKQTDPGGPHPWQMPAPHYVVRVNADGSTRTVLRCTGMAGCEQSPASTQSAVVDLVFVDIGTWIVGRRPAEQDPTLVALDALLDRLDPDAEVPRILVSHYPIEAAGLHGRGGPDPDSTLRNWPPRMQQAILHGVFAGALAAHDRATYAVEDLSDALVRSERSFTSHGVFEVVSGAASIPDSQVHLRRLRGRSSIALVPEAYTPRAGFAVVRLSKRRAEVELHAGWAGHWQISTLEVPLFPAPKQPTRKIPPMQPCLRCAEVPASER